MVLVDRAHPSRLGDLVRALMHRWPDVDVLTDGRDIEEIAPGSVFVLAPREEDAEWLNLRRHIFADRRYKVVLWCNEATTIALARKAVDFFDWITSRYECIPKPAPFAVRGLRAAFEAEWPVVWTGSPEKDDLDAVIHGAFPDEKALWVNGSDGYEQLVSYMKRPEIVVIRVDNARQLRRVRWAYAQARRKGRVILVAPGLDCPGFWPVHDRMQDVAKARDALKEAGAATSGALAALLDFEPEAIDWIRSHVKEDVGPTKIVAVLSSMIDPAVGLSRRFSYMKNAIPPNSSMTDPFVFRVMWQGLKVKNRFDKWLEEHNPKNRYSAGLDQDQVGIWAAHATSIFPDALAKSQPNRSWALEPSLRDQSKDIVQRVAQAKAAESLGEFDIATYWLKRYSTPWEKILLAAAHNTRRLAHILAWIRIFRFGRALLGFVFAGFLMYSVFELVPSAPPSIIVVVYFIAMLVGGLITAKLLKSATYYKTFDKRPGSAFLRFLDAPGNDVESTMARASSHLEHGEFRAAEDTARTACIDAKTNLGSAHPLYEKSLLLVVSIMIDSNKTREPLELVKTHIASDTPISSPIALLSARLLARTGRAADAVQILARLTGQTALTTHSVLPAKSITTSDDEPRMDRLLQCPTGELANDPSAHLALVDALLAQGRYPEALQIARHAAASFAKHTDAESKELRSRLADLERRL